MQEISDKMGNNQFADMKVICCDCHKEFVIKLERTSEKEIEYSGGIIAIKHKNDPKNKQYLFKCPECNEYNPNFGPKVDIYSRVVGYLRPTVGWNDAKQQEFNKRKTYDIPVQEKITAKESKYMKVKLK